MQAKPSLGYPSRHSGLHKASHLPNPPTFIEHKGQRFLIMDAPSESNLPAYYREMEKYDVTDVVRVCDPTYPKEYLLSRGIQVHDLSFPDGEAPPQPIVQRWLSLVQERFPKTEGRASSTADGSDSDGPSKPPTIAVHCIAGLGRAPVLVAIALIESGMEALDVVAYIRQRRRGAINQNQIKFLESYVRKKRTKTSCRIL